MGDFLGLEIMYLLCNFIGGTLRWVYGTIWRTIFNKSKYRYNEYVFGVENSKNHFDVHGHQFNNLIITVVFIAVIATILS
ncbi:hypothetical protein JL193_05960 [Polaribacter batillariae]|uniref:Uncharacterized protein n=1 Tax=Polaribacter batillariae TaxID=2808900 RepID=A0ABX7T150_9FLAO|nr:hypothetical protein [Polaribacter batillariae]QTD38803.1 hypothetical protein JL193_05960 [Polaribacter batillariae]